MKKIIKGNQILKKGEKYLGNKRIRRCVDEERGKEGRERKKQ